MAAFDSADLLARVRRITRTPTSSTIFPTDADMYAFITEAAQDAENRIAALNPKALIGAPVQMVTADGGYTYTFGTDVTTGNIFPLGGVEIFPNLESIPDCPLQEYDEYLVEGQRIRIPGNVARSFSNGGPYARFVTPTVAIDGSTAPTLQPIQARMLFVWDAVVKYAIASRNLADLLGMAQGESDKLWQVWTQRFQTSYMAQGNVAAWGRGGRMRNFPGRENIYRGAFPYRG